MADYTKTEPAFDFQKGDFVIINGRPKMTVGRERIKNWAQKYSIRKRADIKFITVQDTV